MQRGTPAPPAVRRRIQPLSGALRIVLLYAAFAGLWILLSDQLVGMMFKDPATLIRVSMLKGWVFVAVTSALLFGLVGAFGSRIAAQDRSLAEQQAETARVLQMINALVEGSTDAIYAKDLAGRYLLFNEAAGRMVGQDPAKVVGQDDRAIFPLAEAEPLMAADRRVLASGTVSTYQELLTTIEGPRTFLSTKGPLHDDQGRVAGLFGIARDITELLRTERALAENELRFTNAFQFIPVGLVIARMRDRKITTVNEAFLRASGYEREQMVGRTAEEMGLWWDPEARAHILNCLARNEEMVNLEVVLRRADGTPLPVVYSGRLVEMDGETCLLSVAMDIRARKEAESQRQRLEAEIQHAQKLESLGSLASGVAHDMNNVLAAIQSMAEVLVERRQEDPEVTKAVTTITRATTRGRDMVRSLTHFARKDLGEPEVVDLNKVVREGAELLDRTLLQKVRLVLELEDGLPAVLGEQGPLATAIMNLCVNAVQAMPKGGTLTVATRTLPGSLVELTVQDTGEGMTPEVLNRAMEPFFTTKAAGKGTGLGLSMVHGTIKAHGGTMVLHSLPGEGTTVRATFPALAAPKASAPPLTIPGTQVHFHRRLRILLVDDDELIRTSIPALLEMAGHQAEAAPGGREALALLEGGLEVDLVILDLNMPDLGGVETLLPMRLLRPGLPVLVATGYLDAATAEFLKHEPKVLTMAKPFAMADLAAKLKELCP